MSNDYHEGYRRRGREPALPAEDVGPPERCTSQEDFLRKMRELVEQVEQENDEARRAKAALARNLVDEEPILSEHDHAMYRAYYAMNSRKRRKEQEKLFGHRAKRASELIKIP